MNLTVLCAVPGAVLSLCTFVCMCCLSRTSIYYAATYSLGAALRKHNVKKSTLGEAGGGAKKKPSAGRGRSSATPSDWSTGCKKPVRRGDDSSGWSSAS